MTEDATWIQTVPRHCLACNAPMEVRGTEVPGRAGPLLAWRCTNRECVTRRLPDGQQSAVNHPGPYPDNNPKTLVGLAKTPLHLVPLAILDGLAAAFANGAKKYGPFNWRTKKISSSVYYAAAMRHLKAWYDDGEDVAADSGVHHLDHAAACLAMLADVRGTPLLNDDRPPKRPKPE